MRDADKLPRPKMKRGKRGKRARKGKAGHKAADVQRSIPLMDAAPFNLEAELVALTDASAETPVKQAASLSAEVHPLQPVLVKGKRVPSGRDGVRSSVLMFGAEPVPKKRKKSTKQARVKAPAQPVPERVF